MREIPSRRSVLQYLGFCLGLAVSLAGCPSPEEADLIGPGSCPPPISPPLSPGPSEAAPAGSRAAACQVPTTWKLDGITGNASGTWQDIGGSANGTLSGFNPPPTVEEGVTYTVSATFSGSTTAAAGWDGIKRNIQVFIQDYNTNPLLNNQYTTKQVTVTGTNSESVTVTAAWSPKPELPNTTTFTLVAGGGWGVGNGQPVNLVATYSKQP